MNSLYVSVLALLVAVSIVTAAPSIEKDSSEEDSRNATDSGEIADIPISLKNKQRIPSNNSTKNTTEVLVFTEVLEDVIDALKRVMRCGVPNIDLPVLAPYRLPQFEFAINKEFLKLNGEIRNLVVTGLDDILIISLATNSSTNHTTYDLFFKGLQSLGDFDVHVDADLAGYRYVHHAQGMMNIQLENIRYTGGLTIGTNEVGGIEISDVNYYVQVGDVISRSLNTNLTVATQNFVNQYIHDASLLFFQTHRELINEAISGYLTNTTNEALYNTTITEYLTGLVELTELYNSIDCSP